jgi:hypothetical protein
VYVCVCVCVLPRAPNPACLCVCVCTGTCVCVCFARGTYSASRNSKALDISSLCVCRSLKASAHNWLLFASARPLNKAMIALTMSSAASLGASVGSCVRLFAKFDKDGRAAPTTLQNYDAS